MDKKKTYDKNLPLVSIDCLAYNHGPFIRETLEGFLSQKTNFKFEVLVHDDASTDNTAEIIKGYEKKYPELIKPIYQKENQYSQGVSISKSIQCSRAKGKYFAMCEGDDYWTDPHKLQKQVDFLENNPEYGLVHGNIDKLFDKTGRIRRNTIKMKSSQFVSQSDVFNGLLLNVYGIATLTVMARKELICKAFSSIDTSNHLMGDLPTWLELSQKTKFQFLPETLGVYRKVSGSASNTKEKYLQFIESGLRIRLEFANKYDAPDSITKTLNRAYFKNQLLRAYFSKDLGLANQYHNNIRSNKISVSPWDSILYKSLYNKILYYMVFGVFRTKELFIATLKRILKINVY